jgi:uncharacterized repeat protein (TIGR04076 family)
MRNVRITVVDTTFNEKIAKEYGVPNLPVCPSHKVGEVYISKSGTKPDGLCEEAWTCLEKYVFALSRGAKNIWSHWVNSDNISINTCNDGFRPTVFLLEAIEK